VKLKFLKNIRFYLSIFFILLSLFLMTINIYIGFALFISTMIVINRYISIRSLFRERSGSTEQIKKIDRQQINRARTIYVQVVDDHGMDLPPHVVEQKMKQASMNAEPKDNVVPVRYKI
jgi:hypothetical protein